MLCSLTHDSTGICIYFRYIGHRQPYARIRESPTPTPILPASPPPPPLFYVYTYLCLLRSHTDRKCNRFVRCCWVFFFHLRSIRVFRTLRLFHINTTECYSLFTFCCAHIAVSRYACVFVWAVNEEKFQNESTRTNTVRSSSENM